MEEDGDQALDTAIELGAKLISTIFNGEPSGTIKDLINAGAPLWYQDEDGFSALHAACFREDSDLVELLIERGAIWNAGESHHCRLVLKGITDKQRIPTVTLQQMSLSRKTTQSAIK